jgi:hypothetical protein
MKDTTIIKVHIESRVRTISDGKGIDSDKTFLQIETIKFCTYENLSYFRRLIILLTGKFKIESKDVTTIIKTNNITTETTNKFIT